MRTLADTTPAPDFTSVRADGQTLRTVPDLFAFGLTRNTTGVCASTKRGGSWHATSPKAMEAQVRRLALRGYCLLPRFLGTEHVIDELRLACLAQLNEQDTRVLEKLGRGLSNKTIAAELGVSEAAVKALVRSILQKLHLHHRTEAGVFFIRHEDRIEEIARETGVDKRSVGRILVTEKNAPPDDPPPASHSGR